ncbi:MAG: isoprenylcysteine carboxylmethyltransferase family protein [bacterium]|nr:isoprenylcysteine carboxylmethyltransferase family protein [bacterium]
MTAAVWLAGVVVAQRVLELAIARRNERRARAAGAVEVGQGHYWLFFVLHPAWLLGWVFESQAHPTSWGFLAAYAALQGLRVWILASLGEAWNTRILVIPGAPRVARGPYRFMAHPNYVLVALELVVTPLVVGAWRTALVATVANALVMAIRIPAEERALRAYLTSTTSSGADASTGGS